MGMVLGVACTMNWLESLTKLFFELENGRHFAESPHINTTLFQRMDTSGTGYITKADFRQYMLVHHNMVPQHIFDEIDAHFARLHPDGHSGENITLNQIRAARVAHKLSVSRAGRMPA